MTPLRVWVEAVALLGPGLPGWDAAVPVLAGRGEYLPTPIDLPPPAQLSPAERRRAIPSVRLALAVAAAAVARSGRDPSTLASVFASSGADGETIDAVLSALARPEREVSPTRFHNSVHNAPSGYWSLAVRSRAPTTSLSAFDASFAAGLLEAAVQVRSAEAPVLLVAYDLPYPPPLRALRPIADSFGVAMLLAPTQSPAALAALDLALASVPGDPDTCVCSGLEALRRGNPAARSLPLLAALATGARPESIRLAFGPTALVLKLRQC